MCARSLALPSHLRASHENSIHSLCIWNDLNVRLATPWYSNESVILRTVIVRLRCGPANTGAQRVVAAMVTVRPAVVWRRWLR